MKKHLISALILVLSSLACTLQVQTTLDNTPAVIVVTSYKRACMVTTVHKAASVRYGGAEIVKPVKKEMLK